MTLPTHLQEEFEEKNGKEWTLYNMHEVSLLKTFLTHVYQIGHRDGYLAEKNEILDDIINMGEGMEPPVFIMQDGVSADFNARDAYRDALQDFISKIKEMKG